MVMNRLDKLNISEEEKQLVREAFEAGVDSVLDEVYEDAVFDLEMNAEAYDESKKIRRRLPNHFETVDTNSEKDKHIRAPQIKRKLGKLKDI